MRISVSGRVLIPAAITAAVVVSGITAGTQIPSSPVAWSCTVGYAGTDVNVTVSGWLAGSACAEFIAKAPAVSTDQTPLGSGYLRESGGTFMCSYTLSNLKYTVFDEGALKLYGSAVCSYLQQQTPEAKAAAAKAAADQQAAEAQQRAAEAQAAAQQAQEEAARQLAQEQSAIDSGASALESDFSTLAHDADSARPGPSGLANDVGQAQKDLDRTGADLRTVQSEGSGSLSCGADASSVAADASSVQADLSSVEADQSSQQSSDTSVSDDISTVNSDWEKLQSAEAALPSYSSGTLPTQNELGTDVQNGQSAIKSGDQAVAAALKQVQGMVDQAEQDAQKAQATC